MRCQVGVVAKKVCPEQNSFDLNDITKELKGRFSLLFKLDNKFDNGLGQKASVRFCSPRQGKTSKLY